MFALYGNNESVRLMNNPCNIKVVMKATVWQRQNHHDWLSCIEIYHPNQNTLQSSPSNSYFPSFSVHGFDLEKNSRESYLQIKYRGDYNILFSKSTFSKVFMRRSEAVKRPRESWTSWLLKIQRITPPCHLMVIWLIAVMQSVVALLRMVLDFMGDERPSVRITMCLLVSDWR